ncbi:hypothetical protein PNEG_02453 [Pneumocystis murina B123]|uniref:Cdc23 domain-containing protein n=1 Tax=Pneumocystis murina (strain B123) TaxID=1069680 RepID=M7PF66_PNEMU|nr:hypothetical protein PNEG_02453 [Pneumocystis murina B123]EMR09109.1 hypothetical protein PNEG_02453 [Pneumocystis murina B123]
MNEITSKHTIHLQLKDAISQCSERGLYLSARWAAELLNGMEPLTMNDISEYSKYKSNYLKKKEEKENLFELGCQEEQESNQYSLAKCYFDCKEYDRCSYFLKTCHSPKSIFLRLYSKFLAGEKRGDEDSESILGPLDASNVKNREITSICQELEKIIEIEKDAFLLYLLGFLQRRQKQDSLSIKTLIQSLNLYPYNWGTWQELSMCLAGINMLNSITSALPECFMKKLFLIYAILELHQSGETLYHQIMELETLFPNSLFLKTQRALIPYNGRDFEEAEKQFEEIAKLDPHRLDDMDIYSNILFVMSKRSKLGFLAQIASATDKFRPETCCIIGNYYSLLSEHEKAVIYFRRALKLNRNWLSAWTLMGHEYVEMKNTHAAIEAYRRAVDVNRKDYRAWYGLGQTYEVLEMHYYALYYYQRAAALKPYDQRMWQALGNCYEKLDRPGEAIKSYKRALLGSTGDPVILLKLGGIFERIGDTDTAAMYYKQCITAEEDDVITLESSKAHMWLAKWEMSRGNLRKAEKYATEIMNGSFDLEEAKALVRDLRSRMDQNES